MSITVRPVTPDFVAEISGIDLAQPLQPADRDAICRLDLRARSQGDRDAPAG